MPNETNVELIRVFTFFLWILNAFILGMIPICIGCIAWLCYAEGRQYKVRKRQAALSTQSAGRNNFIILPKRKLIPGK